MAQRLSSAEATKLGESRETWCAVEWKKEQDWCRTQRSHFPQQFQSCVFQEQQPASDNRCTFAVDAPTHRQRRHFDEQSKKY